jgi:hypothetical protein
MSRNDAFTALLAIGASIEPSSGKQWAEKGRKMKAPENALCPALFQVEGDTEHESRLGQLIKREQQVTWIIYLNYAKDQLVVPAEKTADLIDAIEAKFGDNGISYQGLGGTVYAAYIKGAIRRFNGDLDGLEIVTVPINILFP